MINNVKQPKVAFCTLGCKVNTYETECMRLLFEKAGYETVSFSEIADVYVINTCTVTGVSDKKSRQMINRAKNNNPNAIIAAVGCYVQTGAKIGADILVGTTGKGDIVNLVEQFNKNKQQITHLATANELLKYDHMDVFSYKERTRAVIKICDGCNNFCSYCIIPVVRGRVRSRSMESIVSEAQRLAKGHKEIVLSGIHVSSYGQDIGGSLIDVCENISKINGVERIRLSSIDISAFTDEFVARLAKIPQICPHFHISLQSGCDEILKLMGRKYTTQQFYETVQKIRETIVDTAITTDIICGFPSETEIQHKQSVEFVKKLKPYMLHVFPYSKREGTAAAKMPEQVSKIAKNARTAQFLELSKQFRTEFIKSFNGRIMPVLFENEKDGYCYGNTMNYIPVKQKGNLCGKIVNIEIGN